MAARSDYEPVMAALDAAGFYYDLRDYRGHGWQLVCVTSQDSDGGLYGPSFWLSRSSGGRWFIMEWGGDPGYVLPAGVDPAAVCLACLRGMGACMRVPPEVVARFGLELIREGQRLDFDLVEPPAEP